MIGTLNFRPGVCTVSTGSPKRSSNACLVLTDGIDGREPDDPDGQDHDFQ